MGEISGKTMIAGWVPAAVSTISHWTDNLFSLRLATQLPAYEAGQYTFLALPPAESNLDAAALEAIAQPYSILSSPQNAELEFFFYTQIEGELSRKLSRLSAGDTLWVKQQADGNLTLTNIADAENLYLIATGTGVAPFISMLSTDEPWQRFKHVVLVYAVRYWQDLCYAEFFDALKARYGDQFKLIVFVSREAAPESVQNVVRGHIPSSLDNGELEALVGAQLSPVNTQIMLCGNPGMVKDAIAVLQARGFSDNKPAGSGQLSYEAYW